MTLSEAAPAPPPALAAATMCEALMMTAAQRPDQVALRSPDDAFSLTFAQLAAPAGRHRVGSSTTSACARATRSG